MEIDKLKTVLEALFAAADKPLSVNQIFDLFVGDIDQPGKDEIRQAIAELGERYRRSGFELKQVASGYRFQVRAEFETWVARLWEQKPPRYSRALMETLALIAYRQPITRGEIEEIRGVSVSSNIIKTLQEREWVKPLGHKDVPGRPALYGTTREFLDYFNLKSLNELPTLAEIRDLDRYIPEFEFEADKAGEDAAGAAAVNDGDAGEQPAGEDADGAAAVSDGDAGAQPPGEDAAGATAVDDGDGGTRPSAEEPAATDPARLAES